MIGTVVGNFKIVEKLGEGGMGAVYRGVDTMVERNVAIKVLRTEIAGNPEVLERFRSEAIALARLNHAAIATLYSFFREGDRFFMAMEFVPGETLEKRIQRQGAFPWQRAVEILLWVLDGVRHAHQMGILHRDLKPANIMLTPDGRVKVTDFGIARVLNTAGLTREARVVGTLEYLAPERALGRPADARSDLYSLGVVFYEMLTGRLPFQSDSDFELMRAQIEKAPPPPRELGVKIPPEIEAALMKALAKDPEDRYPDAAAFASEFREAVRATGVPVANIKLTRVAEQPRQEQHVARDWRTMAAELAPMLRKPEVRLTGIFALVLIAIGIAANGIYQATRPKPPAPVTQQQVDQPLTASGGATSGGGVVPIAPPVVISSEPPAAANPPQQAPPEPAPAPVRKEPSRPPAARRESPLPSSAPAASGSSAEAVRAALEETDSGSTGNGTGPLHFRGVLKALRTGGSGASPLITQAVQARGVNFRAVPDQLIDLRVAGASDALLHAIAGGYRSGTPSAPPSAPPPPPPTAAVEPPPVQPTQPARAIRRLADVRKLHIVPTKDEIDTHLNSEIRSQLGSLVDLTSGPGGADAHLTMEVQDEGGNRVVGAAGRVFGIRGKKKAIVQIVDAHNRKVLWSAEAGDNKAVLGAFSDGARRLASRIAKQLREDWAK